MILSNLEDIDFSKYPVIIFGSGPAGMTTALELEKNNISSVIIEAGEEFYSEESQEFYKGQSQTQYISDISESRLRQFGGTSGIWGGWCKPLEKFAFNKWPITYKDLEIYENKACEFLNIDNSFRQISINQNFNQNEFQYSNVRFADKFEEHIKKSEKILLILNTQLSHFNGKNGMVHSASCISKDKRIEIPSKIFVLSCGGIENSRILLWTKKKNKELLNSKLPIGKYWMTHTWALGGAGILDEKKLIKAMNNNYIKSDGVIHLSSSEKFVNDNKILSSSIYMNKKEDTEAHKEIVKDLLCVAPEYGKKISKMLFNKNLKCGNIFIHIENEANEQNILKLSDNKSDQNQIPQANIDYPRRKMSILSGKKFLEKLAIFFKENDIGRIAINESLHDLEDLDQLGNHHHMGGTRMGNDMKTSVVNKNLKVHNLENLYINGSSNFTTGCFSNPTFTIIQLSLRLADRIKVILN